MRDRFLRRFGVLVLLVSFAGAAGAELCTIDAVPAATLLLPYFEIDLGRSQRKAEDWIISINNGSPAPAIAHVILWTDMSVPTLAFDIFLTGYDVQTLSLGALFFNGDLPIENGEIGGLNNLPALRNAHTGRSVDGECYGRPSGNVARGYVTIDNAQQESVLFPNDGGYFTDVVQNNNQLWGQYYVVKGPYIQSENLISIEAASGSRFGNNDYTFYGRYVDFNGTDKREPLGQKWGARYFASGREKTHLIVWRDSGVEQGPFTCNGLSGGWHPLEPTRIIVWDDQETAVELDLFGSDSPFPAETQIVQVRSNALPTSFGSGWIWLDLSDEAGLQSLIIVRQDLKKRRTLHMAQPFDANTDPVGSGHACGTAPNVTSSAIP